MYMGQGTLQNWCPVLYLDDCYRSSHLRLQRNDIRMCIARKQDGLVNYETKNNMAFCSSSVHINVWKAVSGLGSSKFPMICLMQLFSQTVRSFSADHHQVLKSWVLNICCWRCVCLTPSVTSVKILVFKRAWILSWLTKSCYPRQLTAKFLLVLAA